MDKKQVKYEGELQLGNFIIPCYVLEDGTRILSGRGMQEALKMVDEAEEGKQTSGTRLQRYLGQKTLEAFIYKEKEQDHYNPIICYKGSQRINGYEATVLADICDAFLEARKNIPLSPRQKIIAEQCEILIRGFAKVGIIALVDEATGYQYDRERFELQKILKAYVSDEILKWQLTFTDEFYREVFRLWGLPFIPKYIKNKPSFIGKLTTKYIYDQMPDGVVEKIKENIGRTEKGNYRYKWHQGLTPDVGKEHLKKQIYEVTTLMSISKTKEQFNDLFKQKYNTEPVQLEFEFNTENFKEKRSNFDKSIEQALNFNPNKD
ncbi:hypothetical protein IJD44_00090 [bacterium]|nr:hypothetical protein [bacterium]